MEQAKKEMEELESKQKAMMPQESKHSKEDDASKAQPKDDQSIPKALNSIPENPLAAMGKKPEKRKIETEENVKSEVGSNLSKSSKPKKQISQISQIN